MAKIELDMETANRITLLTLKEYRKYLKWELSQYKKKKMNLHPEDVVGNMQRIERLNLVIRDFE